MASLPFSLSTKGLANIPINDSRNDFEFIVGDAVYRCPSFIADFISPRIAKLHSTDDTIRNFVIETEDRSRYFSEFFSLGRGESVSLTESNWSFHLWISKELCNSEFYDFILRNREGDMSKLNVVKRMKAHKKMGFNYSTEVEFIALHFFEISKSDISELSYEDLKDILSHRELKVESEDSLYEHISNRISSDIRYIELFEFIRFEYLSNEYFCEYIELVTESFEYFTISHWRSLHSRLILPISPQYYDYNDRATTQRTSFHCSPSSSSSPLSGIIAHLTSKSGGNVHDHDVMNITANRAANDNPNYAPKNVADLGTDSIFYSVNEPNQSICFDFKTMKVIPTHYSIRMSSYGPGGCNLKNWVIEGSVDGNSWDELDRRENNSDLNNSYAVKTFSVSDSKSKSKSKCGPFQMIRLRQIGPNHNNCHYLIFTAFEIFGSLIGSE